MRTQLNHLSRGDSRKKHQDGAATLVVVMLLFFIIAMVAAYTSRNLIFEQKTSANQYRSSQAFEAADAGIEWALAMLNGGRIDEACQPSTDTGNSTFRARYIDAIDAEGNIALRTTTAVVDTATVSVSLMPTCVFDATANQWQCRCPKDGSAYERSTGAAPVASVSDAEPRPMFRIRFDYIPPTATSRHDVIRIVSAGCTRPEAVCLVDPPNAPAGDAIAVVTALVALKSGLSTIPGAPLTARRDIVGGGSLRATNADAGTAGVTAVAGSSISGLVSSSLPGVPGSRSTAQLDTSLSDYASGDRMFAALFAAAPSVYSAQPGAVHVPCSGTGGCNAATVNSAAQQNPGRVLWLEGNLTVDGDIGAAMGTTTSPTAEKIMDSEAAVSGPVILIVNGTATLSSGTVFGLVYCRSATWDLGTGSAEVRGALVAEGSLTSTGSQSVVYDVDILTRLRTRFGSFVRVPGGWKDFADAAP